MSGEQEQLPHVLAEAIKAGEVILFLGAGASIGALHKGSASIPDGNDLRNKLADHFLGGKMKDRSLAAVAQYAENEASRSDVQSFIRALLFDFYPAPFHKKIPLFKWHSIVTTNYDLIIERAYGTTTGAKQELIPFYKNDQQVEKESRKAQNPLQFLKLHGCIDHIADADAPLILTAEQYVKFKNNRTRLFERLRDWAHEFPIVFCGYSISDPNVQEVLFDLFDDTVKRPMYYNVQPTFEGVEARYWQRHRITPIPMTLQKFLDAADIAVPEPVRSLSMFSPHGQSSLARFYVSHAVSEPSAVSQYLADDVVHIHSTMQMEPQTPSQFYRGYDTGFGAVATSLDIRRSITDNVIVDAVLVEETTKRSAIELFVVKGAAGNGKTTCLKRAAWDAANDYGALVFYVRSGGAIRPDQLIDIFTLVQRRIFLFVDRAALYVEQILACIRQCSDAGVKLTVVTAERDNEWNTRCEPLDPYLSGEFPVRYLSENEVGHLLKKLEEHGALGLLAEMTYEARVAAFVDRAKRQLLVALHEATLGRPFEEIVVNEYERISPDEARVLYLDICTLHRFGVGVRAGVISRVSGIDFAKFEKELFKPLEKVVFSVFDKYVGDRLFVTRHPHVAEIVFAEVLADPELRLDQIIRILRGLNIDYSVDRDAFLQMTRGRTIASTFEAAELGRSIFKVANELLPRDPYVRHQEAVFELNHRGGSLERAGVLLEEAERDAPHDPSIQHTVAVWLRKSAQNEANELKRKELRRRAMARLSSLRSRGDHTYEATTRISIMLDELREALPADEDGQSAVTERVWVEKMREIEGELSRAKSLYSSDEHLLAIEASYRKAIKDHPRALVALKRAFDQNPRQEWIGIRLADYLSQEDRDEEAKTVLIRVVSENPGAKLAHLRIGQLQSRSASPDDRKLALQHLRSSFSNGDENVEAQYWYARELYLNRQYGDAEELFLSLARRRMAASVRNNVRGIVSGTGGVPTRFRGVIKKLEPSYLFLAAAEGDDVFAHASESERDTWLGLRHGDQVTYELGFSFRGPVALNIRPV